MFRIRKIYDDTSPANRIAIEQVVAIMRRQFPLITEAEVENIPGRLHDPLRYKFRTILFVAEDAEFRVKGFALLLHFPDLHFCHLEFICAAPGRTGGGIGGVLYERIREEAASLNTIGLFFECLPDEPSLCRDPDVLKQNIARMRFYERYGVCPIVGTDYDKQLTPEHDNSPFLMFDDLGTGRHLRRDEARKMVTAILERKYGDMCSPEEIAQVVESFRDDPVRLRERRYIKRRSAPVAPITARGESAIALIVNRGHDIHHVRDRGYVEAPVRIATILKELEKTNIFSLAQPKKYGEHFIRAVHAKDYVDYLHRACASLAPGKSIYPAVFPIRNITRQPKDLPMRAGYYCIDTFTPINQNAYLAAKGAVDCVMTGAEALLDGHHLVYALVRPPGHHAERRAFGGFCYFNSAAVAADYFSRLGRVAVLDIDFHHGNGTQDIFYRRADVLTVSIHGHPNFAYPYFSGFEDERGEAEGEGFNINYPLAERIDVERYHKTLGVALKQIVRFSPGYLVLSLGLDTAKGDPTGTWGLGAEDFQRNGFMIGALKIPTLIVQEGGYLTRTLGINARHFLQGIWDGSQGKPGQRKNS
jgi:acetoin utilization deacetylase AcuC-like enzyme/GNAT superfamily N-acetyltransferase